MTEGTEEQKKIDPQTMDAGRALDAVIAEKVMGHQTWRADCGDELNAVPLLIIDGRTGFMPEYEVPQYSTDMSATVRVIERMRDVLPVGRKTLRLVSYEYRRTYATFNADPDSDDYAEANGEHALPLAICRAALAAMEVQS